MMAEFLRYYNQSSAIEGIAYPDVILYPSCLYSFLQWVFLNICAFFSLFEVHSLKDRSQDNDIILVSTVVLQICNFSKVLSQNS